MDKIKMDKIKSFLKIQFVEMIQNCKQRKHAINIHIGNLALFCEIEQTEVEHSFNEVLDDECAIKIHGYIITVSPKNIELLRILTQDIEYKTNMLNFVGYYQDDSVIDTKKFCSNRIAFSSWAKEEAENIVNLKLSKQEYQERKKLYQMKIEEYESQKFNAGVCKELYQLLENRYFLLKYAEKNNESNIH